MFGKIFGGPTVQLVEYQGGTLLFRTKKEFKTGEELDLKVAGRGGKPAKVKGTLEACRSVASGGYVCTARVDDLAHQRELSRLEAFTVEVDPDIRQHPRKVREVEIDSPDLQGQTVDVSAGGVQVRTRTPLRVSQIVHLHLMPGLNCQAKVTWVSGERAGLEFCIEDDASTKVLLERFASGRTVPSADQPAPTKKTVLPPPDYESV
ncbi:MAG: PilZ domain-containing protein [Vulcanimicrobiota bacterium]